jgi:AraC-like DNA-binding protein
VHAHYAIQVAFGREHGIAFRSNDKEEWRLYRGAIIPSRQPHSMDATKVSANAVMFVEPETREGRVLDELYLAGGIAELPEAATQEISALFAAWDRGDRAAIIQECTRLIRSLTGNVEPRVASDERILRATAYISEHLDSKLTLSEVANAAYLSPSRFRHLFVEQTGMALRPYILWRRFLRVWELAMSGESMSNAAHAAGFADAAHLTRTSRRMFGFPPSALRVGPAQSSAE